MIILNKLSYERRCRLDTGDRYTAIMKIIDMPSEQVLKVLTFMTNLEAEETTTSIAVGNLSGLNELSRQHQIIKKREQW